MNLSISKVLSFDKVIIGFNDTNKFEDWFCTIKNPRVTIHSELQHVDLKIIVLKNF